MGLAKSQHILITKARNPGGSELGVFLDDATCSYLTAVIFYLILVSWRQVDCIIDNRAYEIKLRVTIAASGQGRWNEELDFPRDCQASGFMPVLVVLDQTANTKLDELQRAFLVAGGESYIGQAAWNHLGSMAGPTMARFLEIYVHSPLQELLREVPKDLPDLTLRMNNDHIIMEIGKEYLTIHRNKTLEIVTENDNLPEDVDEEAPTA